MVFQRFGIDARLAQAAESLKIDFFFYEKLFSHSVESQENVFAKLDLDEGREEVLLLPALQWILSGEARKALVLVSDARDRERCASAIDRLGSGAGIGFSTAIREPDGTVRVEGRPDAQILIGELDDLFAAAEATLRDYGFIVADGAELLADLPIESIRKFADALLPSWERRTLLACAKHSSKAKAFAREMANDLVEISVDGEAAKAQSVTIETWDLPGEDKLKFLLGLLAKQGHTRTCVFCNLRDTAEEISRRLEANGVGSDYILGALASDRKRAALDSAKSGEKPCLVLTDQGAEGLEEGAFPLVVNFDIPLEPELFVKRIEMLDRADPAAKIVNLACDRYIYGLPAIESYIDAKLNALPVEESMLSIVDKSEGMSYARRNGSGPGGDGRLQAPASGAADQGRADGRRAQSRGDSRPVKSGQGRRDSRQRDGRSRDGYGREDRSPDIRKSISEATGGSLEMGSSSSSAEPRRPSEPRRQQPNRKPEGQRNGEGQRSGEGRGGAQRASGEQRGGGGKRGSQIQRGSQGQRAGEKQQSQRGGGQKQSNARAPGKSASSRGSPKPIPTRSPGAAGRNPYDLPIEERMKQYREKYGRGIEDEVQGSSRASAPKNGRRPNGVSKPPREAPPVPAPKAQLKSPAAKPEGLLGHLFGAFKKKADR